MDKLNALNGALVADAAALGLHWLYDQNHIALIESTGSLLFRQPETNIYNGVKGYFAHANRHAGQLSHYGESARLTGRICRQQGYDTVTHRQAFMGAFGPCGTFDGYADRPTKALIGRILTETDELQDPSGADDDQFPGLCPMPATFAHGLPRATALDAVRVISVNEQLLNSANVFHHCLELLENGTALTVALSESADAASNKIGELLREALALDAYDPLNSAEHYGLACHVTQGMPLIWHILNHVSNFEQAVTDNIRCGGDTCGRSMVLGAIAAMAYGIPEHLLSHMENGTI